MTFLIDPGLLIIFSIVSYWIEGRIRERTSLPVGKILAVSSLCVIIFTSTSLYLNMWYMDWLWQPFSPTVKSGKDLMINSGIFDFESINTQGLIDALAAIQICLYPLWTAFGIKIFSDLKKIDEEGPN